MWASCPWKTRYNKSLPLNSECISRVVSSCPLFQTRCAQKPRHRHPLVVALLTWVTKMCGRQGRACQRNASRTSCPAAKTSVGTRARLFLLHHSRVTWAKRQCCAYLDLRTERFLAIASKQHHCQIPEDFITDRVHCREVDQLHSLVRMCCQPAHGPALPSEFRGLGRFA